MKILMLVNWKIEYSDKAPLDKQPPDYFVKGGDYWFFRYFEKKHEVDVIDISSLPAIESFEKNKLRFYVIQTLKALPKLKKYDLIISHGMQSGILLSLWRRMFKTKAKHLVFDIGAFNSAAESGAALKMMQYAAKSIDGVIYHTSSQLEYYEKFFPFLCDKAYFVKFGADLDYFTAAETEAREDRDKYIICVGYSKRDWDTLVRAYSALDTDIKLRLVGHVAPEYENIKGVEMLPYIPVQELIGQINSALFCVLPLEAFNYSYAQMTLLQQMALKKCVLAARVPSLADYVNDGETALFYEPKNAEDLKNKLQYLLDNKEVCDKIGANAAEYLKAENNERTMARDIESVINSVTKNSEPKKVLVVNPILYTSESPRIKKVPSIKDTMIYDLCLAFHKKGFETTLYCAEEFRPVENEDYPFEIIWGKCKYRKLFKPNVFPYCPDLKKVLKLRDFDLIISSEVISMLSLSAVRHARGKVIIWQELAAHNNIYFKIPSKLWYNFIARTYFRRIPIVARSEKAKAFISKYCKNVSDTVINHGVNLEKFRPCTEKEKYFIIPSQLIKRKQIDLSIAAFADFAAEHGDYSLYIFGEGEEEESLKAFAEISGVSDRVKFFGKVPHETLKVYLAKATAMLVYTRKDCNMVSNVEAIACATPVVTTSVPYIAPLIDEYRLGIVNDNWGKKELEEIVNNNPFYVNNCLKQSESLSDSNRVEQFLEIIQEK